MAPVSGRRITEAHGMALMSRLAEFNPALKLPAAFPFQCARRTAEVRPLVEEIVRMPCSVTIGGVLMRDKDLWAFELTNFPMMGRTGDYHVWLTAANGEIVDLTILVSLYAQTGRPLEDATPLAGFPEEMEPFVWRPVLVGDDALDALLESAAGRR
ncbi:hypothetical protein DDK22_02060 [Cupriavidus necator]|uniref:Uncharacterized protein n=2 Tax=Cupriavidus necator TaxID=106590 RepID=A0A367PT16_CUPNE|nr:hypothetical protein DDK22_02060 [Cupriavidus necator]